MPDSPRMDETARRISTVRSLTTSSVLARGAVVQPTQIDPSEEWRPLPDFPEYLVSSQGRVWSTIVSRLLKPYCRPYDGYIITSIRQRPRPIHILVALTHIGPRPDGLVVRHLDGDKNNNSVGNLSYGTVAENVQDTLIHGHHRFVNKTHCPQGHEYTPENTFSRSTRPNSRECRTCRRERNRKKVA